MYDTASAPTVRCMSSYGLVVLDRAECERLLLTQQLGRVALCGPDHPTVFPVVFGVLDGDVVFRTAPGDKLVAAVLHEMVAFEVDDYDAEQATGWSVNVVGRAEEIVHPADAVRAEALALPAWAGEARDRYVRIRTADLTGRRVDPA